VSLASPVEDADRIDSRLWPELWISFASLLRVYTAAHGLNSGAEAEVTSSTESIEVRVPSRNRWLQMELCGAKGSWKREDGSEARFSLLVNGNMVVNAGTEEEMDTIAEQLAREIMR
jgi:hypothetical protein